MGAGRWAARVRKLERLGGLGWNGLVGWTELNYLDSAVIRVFRVVRIPWVKTRITHNNFGYRELKPELAFGFFGFGFFGFGLGFFGFGIRVSGIMPSHGHTPSPQRRHAPFRPHVDRIT